MNDDYQQDEAVATGGLRTELRGDVQKAQTYVRPARRMLGHLRTLHGVNERIAAGEAGGFFQQLKQFDDGTLVEVFTNDGHDTVRITCPRPQTTLTTTATALSHVATSESQPTAYVGGVSGQPHPEPPSLLPRKKPEDEDEEGPKDEYRPYLWIGVRQLSGPQNEDGTFKTRLHACVWEPPAAGTDKREILSNRNDLVGYFGSATEAEYPLQSWKQFTPLVNPDTDWQNGLAYTDQKLFMLLERNGYPMRIPDYQPGKDDDITWEVIFINDPDNDLAIQTEQGPMTGNEAGGTYYVKVMVEGEDCGPDSRGEVEVELRIITGKDGYVDDSSHRFTVPQFTKYKMGILPLGWFMGAQSTGLPPCTDCHTPVQDWGSNRHGPHWWQGMATVELAPAQTDVPPLYLATSTTNYKDDVDLPPTGFEPADWFSRRDRCPACVTTEYDGRAFLGFGEIVSRCGADTTGVGGELYLDADAWISSDFWLDNRNFVYAAMQSAGMGSITLTDDIYGVSADVALHYWTGPGPAPYDPSPDPCDYPFGVNMRVFSNVRVLIRDVDYHSTPWKLAQDAAYAAYDADPKYADPSYHGPDPINDFNVGAWGMPDGWGGKAYVLVATTYDTDGTVLSTTARVVNKTDYDALIATRQCAKVERPD